MYLRLFFLTFLKPHLTYISVLVVNVLLTGCEGLSVKDEKPVFTIISMPREQTTQIIDVQTEIQTEETGLSDVKQGAPIPEPIRPETTIKQALSPKVDQTETKLNNAKAIEKTKTTNTSEETSFFLEKISGESNDEDQHKAKQNADLIEPEKISGESNDEDQRKAGQNADLIETDLEPKGAGPLLPEPLTSVEIASLINMPTPIHTPPPLERIKIGTLLSTDVGALKSIMGVPDFVLQNGQMQLWQYGVGECIIDFFLKQNQYDYIVTFIDIRAEMLGDTINEQTCESELAQALNS